LTGLPKYGKISKDFFDRVIYPNLGKKNNRVIVGPSNGVDTSVIKVSKELVLVATTDPISFFPEIGAKYSAWQSVNLIATDLATSGSSPQYALFDFNLPPRMKSSVFEDYWKYLSKECERLGITIVGGHTSRFEGLDSTVIGAGTMFSLMPEEISITSRGGRIGDKVILTKGAAISTTGILANSFPRTLKKKIGQNKLVRAKKYIWKGTAVTDCLIAARAGARAMHDATEGGVLSALYELASASNTGLDLDCAKIHVSNETREVCEAFGIDPYTSLSEGSLVLSCPPSKVEKVVSALASTRIDARIVGELTSKKNGIMMLKEGGNKVPIEYPVVDPYWAAYYKAKKSGLT
jgi:hydrogenase expression/formation protein HypE